MERVSQALIPRYLETVNDSTLYSAIIILMIDQSHSPHNQALIELLPMQFHIF
jgi:hypothetical protein